MGTDRCGWNGKGAEGCCYDGIGGRALWLGQTWKVTAWEIGHLGSSHLGKYPYEVAAWENAFGKVPNIGRSWCDKAPTPPLRYLPCSFPSLV